MIIKHIKKITPFDVLHLYILILIGCSQPRASMMKEEGDNNSKNSAQGGGIEPQPNVNENNNRSIIIRYKIDKNDTLKFDDSFEPPSGYEGDVALWEKERDQQAKHQVYWNVFAKIIPPEFRKGIKWFEIFYVKSFDYAIMRGRHPNILKFFSLGISPPLFTVEDYYTEDTLGYSYIVCAMLHEFGHYLTTNYKQRYLLSGRAICKHNSIINRTKLIYIYKGEPYGFLDSERKQKAIVNKKCKVYIARCYGPILDQQNEKFKEYQKSIDKANEAYKECQKSFDKIIEAYKECQESIHKIIEAYKECQKSIDKANEAYKEYEKYIHKVSETYKEYQFQKSIDKENQKRKEYQIQKSIDGVNEKFKKFQKSINKVKHKAKECKIFQEYIEPKYEEFKKKYEGAQKCVSERKQELLEEGAFLREHSQKSYFEDVADTFVYFVLADERPERGISKLHPIFLEKLLVFWKDKEMVKIREAIRANLKKLGVRPNMSRDEIKHLLDSLQISNNAPCKKSRFSKIRRICRNVSNFLSSGERS